MRTPDPLRILFVVAITAAVCVKGLYWVKGDELRNPPPVYGTSHLSGVVLDTGNQPVAHAAIRARARGIDHVWTGRSDSDGRFRISHLPAAAFIVSAMKDGYVETYHGEREWGMGLRTVALDVGQGTGDLRIALPRAGAIAGVVYDEHGQPASRKFMRLLRRRTNGVRSDLVAHGGLRGTDAQGRYRFENLMPGTYYVMAAFDAPVLARVYHPNAPRVAQASPIVIGVGEERLDVDLHYRSIPSSRVSGTVVRHDGGTLEDVTVRLARAGGEDPDDGQLLRRIGKTGRFEFGAVPAGSYWLVAHGTGSDQGDPAREQQWWAFSEIEVDGRQLTSATLALTPGVDVSGTIELQNVAGAHQVDRSQVLVSLIGIDARTDALLSLASLRPGIAPNGSFVVSGVPAGRYVLQAWRKPWLTGAVTDATQRPLDLPFEITSGTDVRDVRITLVDRQGGVSGVVRDDQGQPIADHQLIVFPADPGLWTTAATRAQLAWTSADGAFEVEGLVAGDYLIAAIEDVNRERWFSRALLERAAVGAARVSLAAGERKTQDVRIPTRISR